MSRVATPRTYNPHLLAREDLVGLFVARRALLDQLVDDLRRGGHQHHLLVGARGSGKTMLLLRLAVAIEEDKKLASTAIPLRFPEEQYNVSRPSDFWLNCLDALADALEAHGEHAGKRALEATIASIETHSEEHRSSSALEALTQWAKRANKLIVLLVDNLGLVLERLRDSHWGLREALSRDNRLVLIGATSSFLEESADYQSPLYDFFNVHDLGQVPEDEARAVVTAIARLTGAAEVDSVLDSDPGRFKALYVLTGGTPRMLAMLAGVLAQDGGPAEGDLEMMLDQLTPYYKARFDELPPQAQILVDAVALHWHPITAASLAERTRIEINVVSAQLNRLVKLGLLAKVTLAGESKLGFQLVERFFNIWYLMRASRRARQKLAWFVGFLRMFYSEEELSRRAQALLDRSPGVTSSTHVLALAAAVPDVALRRRLECRAVTILLDDLRPERIHELLDLGGVDAHLSPVADRARAVQQLRARLRSHPKIQRFAPPILRNPVLPLAGKLAYVDRLAREGPEAASRWRVQDSGWTQVLGEQLMTAIERGELPTLMEVANAEEAIAMIELARSPHLVASLLLGVLDIEQPAADSVTRVLLERALMRVELVLVHAATCVVRGDWKRARALARAVLQRIVAGVESGAWASAISFLLTCARHGHAADAAQLIDELDLQDRWLPLHEALLVAAGDRDRLSRLAPEVKAPTTELLAALEREPAIRDPSTSESESRGARAEPVKKAARKRTRR